VTCREITAARKFAALLVMGFIAMAPPSASGQTAPASDGKDPVLQAMLTELQRSKDKLKLENVQAPYYIEYRVSDNDQYIAEAAFGALRTSVRAHLRMIRIVVRVGDYKEDSYYGSGQGLTDVGPLDDDILAMRHELWLGTDRAYKAAAQALTAKQADLKQFKVDVPVDDFAHASPLQSVGPLAKLEFDPKPYEAMIEEASGLYRSDPQIESLSASVRFGASNQYFVNTEGTVVRNGKSVYQIIASGYTQAADGMRLDRSHSDEGRTLKELPDHDRFMASTRQMLATFKSLRDAPVTEEEYRGPVLFSGDAAASVVAGLIAPNVLGKRPRPGENVRTTGAWATNYKSRVLPEFISVVDDPTVANAGGEALFGSYEIDDEGVKAARVPVVEKGQLVNYLLGRTPIRDFPASNGHGRTGPGGVPGPSVGNLIVQSEQGMSSDELKQKLMELCKQRDLPYGYFVGTMGPASSPRLLYRVYAKDGREELVRGAVFGDLDLRSLRNGVVAAGKDLTVENRLDPVPQSIASPAFLFDELEIKRADASKEKLPDYPAPPLGK